MGSVQAGSTSWSGGHPGCLLTPSCCPAPRPELRLWFIFPVCFPLLLELVLLLALQGSGFPGSDVWESQSTGNPFRKLCLADGSCAHGQAESPRCCSGLCPSGLQALVLPLQLMAHRAPVSWEICVYKAGRQGLRWKEL